MDKQHRDALIAGFTSAIAPHIHAVDVTPPAKLKAKDRRKAAREQKQVRKATNRPDPTQGGRLKKMEYASAGNRVRLQVWQLDL